MNFVKNTTLILLLAIGMLDAPGATFNWTNTFAPSGKQYNPGDTVNFWGSNWALPTFVVTNSGTPGNPITFQWQTGCSITYTSLVANGVLIELSGTHDLIFDGGSGVATPSVVSIGLTDNGTTSANSPGTNTYGAHPTYLMNGYNGPGGTTNTVFKNLTMRGNFNRMGYTNQGHFDSACIRIHGNNITVSNCFFGESDDAVFYGYFGPAVSSNLWVIGNSITNSNHGITVATASAGAVMLNVYVQSNHIDMGDMFETIDGGDVGLHRDPIFFFSEAPAPARASLISNVVISANFISDGQNPQSTTAGSAAVFLDFYHTDQADHIYVYNNLSILRTNLNWSGGGGFFETWGKNGLVANNTAVAWKTNGVYGGGSAGFSTAATNSYGYNNILICNGGVFNGNQIDTTGLTADNATKSAMLSSIYSDFNIFNGQGNNAYVDIIFDTNTAAWVETILTTISQWRGIYGGGLVAQNDPHSKTNIVTLDANYVPIAGDTVARLSGTNLTSFGITNDFNGVARPATGNWTIGAFQETNGVVTPTIVTVGLKTIITGRTTITGRTKF